MVWRKWIAALIITFVPSVFASELNCWVVTLSDGDTFTCLDVIKKQYRIRLANIDTSEKNQPYGTKDKQILSSLIFNKLVLIEMHVFDRYGQVIGITYIDGINVNREMVARGAAWIYPQYNRFQSLPTLENKAKSAGLGILASDQAPVIPLWEWWKSGNHSSSEFSERKT
jgi:endonuclease YncB( thermonuclease family)